MNEKFFDLKKEKQDRIINAALKVFAVNGYRHASTDDIVSEAGISKGLLFHYFTSKLGLYSFLYDYSVRFMTLELSACGNGEKSNYFSLYKQMESAKLQVLKNYPHMQQYLDSTMYENVKEALLATEEKRNMIVEAREAAMSGADMLRFKTEADPVKIGYMLEYTIRGMMAERFYEGAFHPEMLYREIAGYLDMMERLCYA